MAAQSKPEPRRAGPPRFILYRRVSSEEQVDRDLSLPQQAREQHAYVAARGGIVIGEFEDGAESGREIKNREAVNDALALAEAERPDFFLVHKSDRAFRSRYWAVVVKHRLKQAGVRFVSVTEPFVGGDHSADRAMEGMVEVWAQLYSDNLSEEVHKGRRAMAEKKKIQGGHVPYGYRHINKEVQGSGWEIDPLAAVWVRHCFARVLEGASYADLCRELNAAAAPLPTVHAGRRPTRTSRPSGHWVGSTLRQMLANRVYLGEITFEGRHLPGAHPPLIDADTFARVRAVLEGRAGRRSENARGLFAGGLLRCPKCGHRMYHKSARDSRITGAKGGSEWKNAYACGQGVQREQRKIYGHAEDASALCEGFTVGEKTVLRHVRMYLQARAGESLKQGDKATSPPRPAALLRLAVPAPPARDVAAERAVLEKDLAALPDIRVGYLRQNARGRIGDDELDAFLAELDRQRDVLTRALDELTRAPAPPTAQISEADACDLLAVLDDATLTPRQKRDCLRFAFAYIVPHLDRRGVDLVPQPRAK